MTFLWACLLLLSTVIGEEEPSGPPGIDWGLWWTYDGISGPKFWGVINPEWSMCREGRRQSPISVDPRTLLFDPNLTPFSVDKATVNGKLVNTGHGIEWRAAFDSHGLVNITGGPLSYTYTLSHARLHFGARDTRGSEHLVGDKAFPAELQLYGYNSQLYRNYTQAAAQVYGIVGIALLIQIGEHMTPELRVLLEGVQDITYGGTSVAAASLVVHSLLPNTAHYLTYEGSLTEPACHESVTWIIPNKPIYLNGAMMHRLRQLRQGNHTLANAPLSDNYRPIQAFHHRTVRTNIYFTTAEQGERCHLHDPRIIYRAGSWLAS